MKKISKILILTLILSVLSSCEISSQDPSMLLYQKYSQSVKNIDSLDSFTKDENVHIDLSSLGDQLNFNVGSNLKYENKDDSDIRNLSINLNDENDIVNIYYDNNKIYIDNTINRSKVYVPNLIGDLSNISLVSKMKKSDLISATSTQQDGFEQITFIFNGKDTSIYLNNLTDIGIKNIDVLEITPSDVTMVANINDDGYLTDQQIIFNTKISLEYDGTEYDSTINYDATIKIYDFNNTSIDSDYKNNNYKAIDIYELKKYLSTLLN